MTTKSLARKHKGRICAALALAASTCCVLWAPPAQAQFGPLLQQLQQLQRNAGQPGAVPGAPGMPGMPGAARPGAAPGQRGQPVPEQWCADQAGALRGFKVDTSVIASEFNIPNLESLQDEFYKALKRTQISRTFPDARFFKASFETRRVRAIYDIFLAFPEPDTLAALIQISRSSDRQEAGDASMALTFLHLQAPHLSATPNRGGEWIRRMIGQSHYTAQVFRARVFGYGEMTPKNLAEAAGAMQRAGALEQQYRQSGDGGIKMEFDIQNYGTVLNATARDLLRNEPNFPYRQNWESGARMVAQIEASQRAYAERFPRTALGKIYRDAAESNLRAIELGNQLITRSQGGNQLAGQLASLESLQSSQQGERQTFSYMHPEAHANQLRLFSKVGQLDPEQRQLAAQAQEIRLASQGMLVNAMSALTAESLRYFGDIVSTVTPLEAIRAANEALIQSCSITAKWEQALRARDVPPIDKAKVAADVGRKTGSYKDD